MSTSQNTFGFKFRFLILMLCFALSISFVPGNIYVFFFYAIMCWLFLAHDKYWNKQCLFLLVFSFAYAFIPLLNHSAKNNTVFLIYLLIPVAFYRFGRSFVDIFKTEKERLSVFIIILLSYLCPFFILVFKDIALVGFINQTRELLGESGQEQTVRAATLYGLMSSTGLGCITVIYVKNINIIHKFFFFAISCLCLLAVVHLINRTGIIILIFSLFIGYLLSSKFKLSRFFLFLLLFFLFIILILETGLISEEIFEAYNARETGASGNAASAGGRTALWEYALENLFVSPFGWKSEYAHNLWLDIARVAGLLAFIPFCFVTIRFFADWLRVARKKAVGFNYIVLLVSFSMLINSAVEPVIEGSIIFFSLEMMIWGMLRSLAYDVKYSNKIQ